MSWRYALIQVFSSIIIINVFCLAIEIHKENRNEERPEDLFQRLTAFFEDNLLTVDCGLMHYGGTAIDEDMSPLENTIILLWLQIKVATSHAMVPS